MAIGSLVQRDPFFAFHRGLGLRRAVPAVTFSPKIDAVETNEEYRILAELPGLTESDFTVEIEDGVLTLKGEKTSPHDESSEEEGVRGYRRRETHRGVFERRLRFGSEVDEDAVRATFANGALEVHVPKRAEVRPEVRTIPVQTS